MSSCLSNDLSTTLSELRSTHGISDIMEIIRFLEDRRLIGKEIFKIQSSLVVIYSEVYEYKIILYLLTILAALCLQHRRAIRYSPY